MALDPTYDKQKINANVNWQVAFLLSEWFNDHAPLGWYKYIPAAEAAIAAARAIQQEAPGDG